jgi:two-component sensor histidine kinase
MDDDVYSADQLYTRCRNLTAEDVTFLKAIAPQMSIVADVSRSDILMYGRVSNNRAVVLAHARPHSLLPVYPHSLIGMEFDDHQVPLVFRTLKTGNPQQGEQKPSAEAAAVVDHVYPMRKPGDKRVLAAFRVVTNLLENERHRRRNGVFQRALNQLHTTVLCDQLVGAEDLSPFGEHDGIIVADRGRVIRYASGIATNLYRRAGYLGRLVGQGLSDLEMGDDDLVREALSEGRCVERKEEAGGRHWDRKAVPILNGPGPRLARWAGWLNRPNEFSHVILLVHDATEARRQQQKLRVKTAMIQEVHHRVKNNLQTIAALLRMQARRLSDQEARTAMEEAVARILSVAVIHEFLSQRESRVINIKDVSSRIMAQTRQGVLSPEKDIRLELDAPPIYLPARQATACALIINELLQNAMEHGFKERNVGQVCLSMQDEGDTVVVRVRDDGNGLPSGFKIEESSSLGLQIVQTLVKEDLKGTIEIKDGGGAEVIVTFPKATLSTE